MGRLDYLAIGHLTVDRFAAGLSAGGSVAYAAETARRLGLDAGLVTVAGDELDWDSALPGIRIARKSSPTSTSFENEYTGGRRSQRLLSLADDVTPDAVPAEWRQPRIVHLAPVVHEVNGGFPEMFQGALIGLTPQGLLRSWNSSGRVAQGPWSGDEALLANCEVVIFSEEDSAGEGGFLVHCRERVPLVVLTHGTGGATLFTATRSASFPAFPTRETDPTGAGDVFASAFLIEYYRSRHPYRATAFACCAASFAVERPGLGGIQDRAAVEQRLTAYYTLNPAVRPDID